MTAIASAITRADDILGDAALPGYSEQLALMKRAVAVLKASHAYTIEQLQLRASLVHHIKLADPTYTGI